MDPIVEMDEIAAAQMERDAWRDYEERYESAKPALTCGGIGVNYTLTANGRIKFA